MAYTEEELIEGLKEDRKEVLHELYQIYIPKIQQHLAKNSGSHDEARDVWQDCLLALIKQVKSGTFQAGNIHGYIRGIYVNLWLKKLREKKNKGMQIGLKDYQMGESPEDLWGESDWKDLLLQAVGEKFFQLGKKCQQIMNLKYEGKKSHDEISEIMSITTETSRNTLYRCMRELKKMCWNDLNFPPQR